MSRYEVTRRGQVFNVLDDMDNAREEAVALANREHRTVQIVNGTPGEPRYLLEEVEPCCDGTGWTGNPSERCTEHYEPHDLGEFGFIAVH